MNAGGSAVRLLLSAGAALALSAADTAGTAAMPEAGSAKSSGPGFARGAGQDYMLYAPLEDTETRLIDRSNRTVHRWSSRYEPGQSAYLQKDGSLVRAGFPVDAITAYWSRHASVGVVGFNTGGIVERISAADEVEWSFEYYGERFMPHHDVEVLPNGNLLMIVWRARSEERAIAAGRDPDEVTGTGVWLDSVVEVKPKGRDRGKIVWKWSAWDHLVQDENPSLPNYGNPSDHPGRIDINYVPSSPDLMHSNSITYLKQFDQVILGVHNYSEMWVIDHSTTTKQARTDSGGRSGKGGELLYRWGNPAAYGHDTSGVFTISGGHDANGLTGDGSFIVYDNNVGFSGQPLGDTELVEIDPPVTRRGRYVLGDDGVFGPRTPLWTADLGFSAEILGTAERLRSGATFSCNCLAGQALLVGADGSRRWTQQLGQEPAFRIVGYRDNYRGVGAALVGLRLKLAKRLAGSRLKVTARCRRADCRLALRGNAFKGNASKRRASAAFRAIKPRRAELPPASGARSSSS